jgi:hypothetical protein
VAGFELALEDEGWEGELFFWEGELGAIKDLGWERRILIDFALTEALESFQSVVAPGSVSFEIGVERGDALQECFDAMPDAWGRQEGSRLSLWLAAAEAGARGDEAGASAER